MGIFVLLYNGIQHLCRGQIEEWTLRKGIQNGYVGEISAECTDGSDLPSGKRSPTLFWLMRLGPMQAFLH